MTLIAGLRKRFSSKAATGWTFIALVFLVIFVGIGEAATETKTIAEIALYRGPDREKILIEGAKKEGSLVIYSSNPWIVEGVARAFEKKYPFVKISSWRGGPQEIFTKVTEEYAVKRFLVDVIEGTNPTMDIFVNRGILRERYTPDVAYYDDEVMGKGKIGVYYIGDRSMHMGLGFNTKLISMAEAPKTNRDLLDPRWKRQMSIAGGDLTWIRWGGNLLEEMGLDFLKKLSTQDMSVQMDTGTAMVGLIVSGEVPLSPTVYDAAVFRMKEKGAPIDWLPLEPVLVNIGYTGMSSNSPHPYSALLFLDYLHSKQGQEVVLKGGYLSPRNDMGASSKIKKKYFDKIYSIEELEKKYKEWEALLKQLFIDKR
jgi:iron(III) transport system substrate-binding protein